MSGGGGGRDGGRGTCRRHSWIYEASCLISDAEGGGRGGGGERKSGDLGNRA
jgi:hypothetical protein